MSSLSFESVIVVRDNKTHFLKKENGFGVLAMVAVIAMTTTIMMGYNVIGNAREKMRTETFIDGRKKVSTRVLGYLQSLTMMSYNLSNQNSPDKNTALRDCVIAGEPSTVCPNSFGLEFYAPLEGGKSEKVIGSETSPAYQNQLGQVCIPLAADNHSNCQFKAVSKCWLSCPGGQTACGMVKMIQCDVEVSAVADSIVAKYMHLKKTTRFASSYSIRLSRDQKSYVLNRE